MDGFLEELLEHCSLKDPVNNRILVGAVTVAALKGHLRHLEIAFRHRATASAILAPYSPPLCPVTFYRHFDTTCALIQTGADINASDRYSSPLCYAADARGFTLVDLLLQKGAKDTTTLHLAARALELGLLDRLVDAGLSINACDSTGAKALQTALSQAPPSIAMDTELTELERERFLRLLLLAVCSRKRTATRRW